MFHPTVRKRYLAWRSAIGLTIISLLALAVIATCVSCGGGSSEEVDRTETKTETEANTEVETTTKRVELTQNMYDSIELEMGYQQVLDIIGQEPNEAREVDDPEKPKGKVLKCSWLGRKGTGKYLDDPRLDIFFYEDKVCQKESSNL